MLALLAQIAPQRSTQYSALASALAPHELQLSVLRERIASLSAVELGGQPYLKCELSAPPTDADLGELGMFATMSAFFEYAERLGERDGPWLRPIETRFRPAFPPELAAARRYKGKTNELFTHFMCNVARFSSAFAGLPWRALRVFDPLAGGGTTLFTALVLGAEAAGVERCREDVESTVAFLAQYAREQGIAHTVKEERLKQFGRRWRFTFAAEGLPAQCVLARGETAHAAALMDGVKRPHLIVADLPYGIRHRGELAELLEAGLPVWSAMLLEGGALVFAWESARFPRAEMIGLVESCSGLHVLNEPPYDRLAHRVDRVIKQRDVIVARKAP
ncbi:MAG: hypothetical protein RMN52_08210 [Anaerolineae bacterium]|nr:hypothetical protein [Candidatus Roseilinea sp.]MDW8449973.1 hypothetical protein [Anaerolineae bacterium]